MSQNEKAESDFDTAEEKIAALYKILETEMNTKKNKQKKIKSPRKITYEQGYIEGTRQALVSCGLLMRGIKE